MNTKTKKFKIPKKPTLNAAEATEQVGKIELQVINAIKYWVYNSPEQAIMIKPDLEIYVTDPDRYSLGKNAQIEQVRFNEAGQIVVRTDQSKTETLIHYGDFATGDIVAVLEAIEETIVIK